MKTVFACYFFLVLFISASGQSPAGSEQSLLNLESQRLEAIVSRNHEFLTNLFDNEFHGVLASGQSVNKTKIIEFLESSNPHIVQANDDVRAKIYGTVGITTGKLVSKSKSGSIIGQSRFTHIYLRKNDQWKMIESQGTVIIQE